jgi:hypothetical protein
VNAIIVIVPAATILVTALLALVVAGIKLEPPAAELSTKAPNLTAAIVRRALGVSARETCPTGQRLSNWPEGRNQ